MDGSETTANIAPVSGVDLSGTWHLADMRLHYADGRVRRPWARSASGSLIYAPDGHMCLSLNYPTLSGRIDCMSFCGAYQIVEDKVLHHVTASADVSEIGTVRELAILLENRRLTLTQTPAATGGPGSRLAYVWEKADMRSASHLRSRGGSGFNRGR